MNVAELERFIKKVDDGEHDEYDGVSAFWAADLARRVIAAEKLVHALRYYAEHEPEWTANTIVARDALTAYEATK